MSFLLILFGASASFQQLSGREEQEEAWRRNREDWIVGGFDRLQISQLLPSRVCQQVVASALVKSGRSEKPEQGEIERFR